MTRAEIISLARLMRTLRDGLRRAFNFLRQLGFNAREQCEALIGV